MALHSFTPPSHALVDYHLEMDVMPLHDAIGVNCKMGGLKIKAQVLGVSDKGCVFDD